MKIKIDIFSDAVCPWCYVGKKRLERAIDEMSEEHQFDVVWHPFELNPNMPKEGVPREEHLGRKFGSVNQLHLMDARMKDLGKEEGIEFNHDEIQRTPNTLDAHRLIWFAGKEGRQAEVVENLFRAYFTEGRDIGDRDVLKKIADESGLGPKHAARFLDSDEGRTEVQDVERQIRMAGIRGVPLFIINDEIILEGAEPPESFVQAVESLRSAPEAGAATA